MPISDVLAELFPGLTQQQGQRIVQSFAIAQGPVPEGVSLGAHALACLRKFCKASVKGADRKTAEDALSSTNAATDAEFGD
jgi:hypothetical protein